MATPALKPAAFSAIQRTIIDFPLAAVRVRPFFFSVCIVERIAARPSCCWRQVQRGKPIQKPLQGFALASLVGVLGPL